MATTANGWPVLDNDTAGSFPRLRKFVVPGTGRHFLLRDGCIGFVLAVWILRFHETVERLDLSSDVWDEWGYANRPQRGQTTGYSEHAGGNAADVNATRHPMGVPVSRTFTPKQIRRIRWITRTFVGVVEWGGEWRRPDGMHAQIARVPLTRVNRLALVLAKTARGKRILAANPGLLAVIKS